MTVGHGKSRFTRACRKLTEFLGNPLDNLRFSHRAMLRVTGECNVYGTGRAPWTRPARASPGRRVLQIRPYGRQAKHRPDGTVKRVAQFIAVCSASILAETLGYA